MAKIAIIGSSFSKCLYSAKDEPNMSGWTTEKRIEWAENEWYRAFILEDYEKHWVNLLSKKYPQHEFHIFAKGGAGWEFSEIVLHKLAELKFDRVIIELQEPRLLLYNKKTPLVEFMLDTNYLEDIQLRSKETSVFNYPNISARHIPPGLDEFSHICFYDENWFVGGPQYCDVKKLVKTTVQQQIKRAEYFNSKVRSQSEIEEVPVYTEEVIDYMTTNIKGPIYATRYKQYLLSLKNVWPKVFDKVGVWAYLSPNMPWFDLDLHAEIFGDELKIFEDIALEKWIRADPINNSVETWRTEYYGSDRQHANEEGMKLIVDFLLKQSSIQEVLK